jgi:signal peptidase I
MDDDQSMRDRMAGLHGPGDQAGDGPKPGGLPTAASQVEAEDAQPDLDPGSASPGHASQDQAGQDQAGQDEAGQDEPADEEASDKGRRGFWRELPVLIVVALVIALVIKTFVVQAFYIPSSSMEDTLLIGDKVLVNKVVFHVRPIHVGDIIVFDGAGSWDPVPSPSRPSSNPIVRLYHATLLPLLRSIGGLFGTAPGQTDYIKRVIGVPGDHVACCNAAGQVTINGVALQEGSYLYPGSAPSEIRFHDTVPAGRLWVMGDNRLVSDDSRLHTVDPGNGTVPENKVIGRAAVIVWPPDRWRILQIPTTFGQPGVTKSAAAAVGALGARAGSAAPYLPLAGGFAVALPVTWLRRRVRMRRRALRPRGLRPRGLRPSGLRPRVLRPGVLRRSVLRRRAPRCR